MSIFEKDTAEEWKSRIIRELKGTSIDEIIARTIDGIEVQPFYVDDGQKSSILRFPDAPWTARQDFDSDDVDINKHILEALESGVSCIGVPQKNLEQNLRGVIADMIEVNITEIEMSTLLADWNEYSNSSGIALKDFKGSFSCDPLGMGIYHGSDAQSVLTELKLLDLLVADTSDLENWNCVQVHGELFHNAGASVAQELGIALSQVNEYLEQSNNPTNCAKKIQVSLSASSDYFMTAAKISAMRHLWANILRVHGIENSSLKIIMRTSKKESAKRDEHGNLLRSTVQAMASIVGGADQVIIDPYDGSHDASSYRWARNIHNLLKDESYFDKNHNPLEGAYMFERLARDLSEKAWELFKDVENEGGFLAATTSKMIQEKIGEQAEVWVKGINEGSIPWLGVNLHSPSDLPAWQGLAVEHKGSALPKIMHQS